MCGPMSLPFANLTANNALGKLYGQCFRPVPDIAPGGPPQTAPLLLA